MLDLTSEFRKTLAGLCAPLILMGMSSAARAQSVETVTFRVPVEISDIRYLSSVAVQCMIQDLPLGTTNEYGLPERTRRISNQTVIRFFDEDDPVCTGEVSSGDDAYCSAGSATEGRSWSGEIEVPISDFQSGPIRVSEGAAYKCSTAVRYDEDPLSAGEPTLEDALCAGFYENPFSITARERYNTYTGGDIAAARLCTQEALSPVGGEVTLPAHYIRGGECCEDEPAAEPPASPESRAILNPELATRLPARDLTAAGRIRESATNLAPLTSNARACHEAVQGQIAWDYNGNTQWGAGNVDALCEGAENSTQPAICFERAMHGDTPRPAGPTWHWREALDLCAGSRNAAATLSCYENALDGGASFTAAIDRCGS